MTASKAPPRQQRPIEGRIRRSVELGLLALSLFVGLGVIAGCGGCLVLTSEGRVDSAVPVIGVVTLAVGVVYLYVSMSRDVRVLRERIVEREERSVPPDRPAPDA